MELIAKLNSRSDPQAPHREQTFVDDDYATVYQKVQDSLLEDDLLLSVRRS